MRRRDTRRVFFLSFLSLSLPARSLALGPTQMAGLEKRAQVCNKTYTSRHVLQTHVLSAYYCIHPSKSETRPMRGNKLNLTSGS